MLIVTMEVAAPMGAAIGVKEALAMDVEKYGDVRVISVEEIGAEQISLTEAGRSCRECRQFEPDGASVEGNGFRCGVCHRGGRLTPVYDPSRVCDKHEPR